MQLAIRILFVMTLIYAVVYGNFADFALPTYLAIIDVIVTAQKDYAYGKQ